MSYHGANFPRRLTWEWAKKQFHYCLPLIKNIHILLFQKQILMTDFIIIRLQTSPKATLT